MLKKQTGHALLSEFLLLNFKIPLNMSATEFVFNYEVIVQKMSRLPYYLITFVQIIMNVTFQESLMKI